MDVNPFVVFEVKLDKDRGIVVLTIRKEEHDDVCFFRFYHQPLSCHPQRLQELIRSVKVTARTKSIKANIYGYLSHYWDEDKKYFQFKGLKLDSTTQQLVKAQNIKINKEIGVLKRKENGPRERKQAEMEKLKQKNVDLEAAFQLERAERIAKARLDIKKKQLEQLEQSKMPNDAEMQK